MNIETTTHGDLTITRSRPFSTLAVHEAAIAKVLKKPLPRDVAAFYAQCDGITYSASRNGKRVGFDATLCGLDAMFAGFQRHRQYKNMEAFEEAVCEGAIYDAPFCGEIWSEDFEVNERSDLTRFNALVRSKLLVSIEGASAALIIDFSPIPKKGESLEYQIALAYEGNDHCPLELDMAEFVAQFERFGACGWYYAYVGRKSIETLNINAKETVTQALEPYANAFPDEVDALIKRAKRR